jgi:hypothetical protein
VTRLHVALGAACGFLLGVVVAVALASGGGATDTVTRVQVRTVTVTQNAVTTGGTVITRTLVPPLVGERLDVAKSRLHRSGFDPHVTGGGLLGILRDANWNVVSQDPAAGTMLEQGSSVTIHVERR